MQINSKDSELDSVVMLKKLKESDIEIKAANSKSCNLLALDVIQKQKSQITQLKKEIATLKDDQDKLIVIFLLYFNLESSSTRTWNKITKK